MTFVCMEPIYNTEETQNPVRPAPVSKYDQVSRMLYHSNFACNIPLSAAFLHSVLALGTSAQVSL